MNNLKFSQATSLPAGRTLLTGTAVMLCGILSLNAQFNLPADWAYSTGSEAANAEGFAGQIHQARANANLSATVALGNAQLDGTLTDPSSDPEGPYENLAKLKSESVAGWLGYQGLDDGYWFIQTNMVNYGITDGGNWADVGNFQAAQGIAYEDYQPPGLPGATQADRTDYSNKSNFAIEHLAFLQLSPGLHTLGVRCNDAFELALHPNDARDIFRTPILTFDSNRGAADSTVQVQVAEAGLYSVRLLHKVYQNPAISELEFYSASADNLPVLTLVNDRSQAGAIQAWHNLNGPTRPYVRSVSPSPGDSGVASTATIQAVLVNLGGEDPVMRVNGTVVTPDRVNSGNEATLTYTPTSPLPGGQPVTVEIDYGGTTGSWSYVVKSGRKALMYTGGGTVNAADAWVRSRLATNYSLDVTISADSQQNTNDATGAVLIVFSSTCNAGGNPQIGNPDRQFKELSIPILNWEQGFGDDLSIHGGGGGNFNNQTQLEIVGAGHPLTAGLADGIHTITTAGGLQYHWLTPPPEADLIASDLNASSRGLVFGIEAGVPLTTPAGEFIHPARRVHLGYLANDGASQLTTEGEALFDAAVEWLVPPPAAQPVLTMTLAADGNVTISWTESGTLYEAPALDGAWTASSVTNGQTIPASETAQFYQVR
jgi:hypothetical protein